MLPDIKTKTEQQSGIPLLTYKGCICTCFDINITGFCIFLLPQAALQLV